MATTTTTPSSPSTSPHDEAENDDQQPVISSTPPGEAAQSQSLPIEEVDHNRYQQLPNSNSTYSPPPTSVAQPETPVDHQQQPSSEDVEDEQEPQVLASLKEDIIDRLQPLPPASPPSLLPPPLLPTGVEHPPETTDTDHESPNSKQPPPTGPEDVTGSPNYHKSPNPNPNSDHESLSPSSPTTLQENPRPKSHQSPQNPSPSPPPTTGSPPPPPPLGVPLLLQTVAISSLSKPQSSPRTHHETANLIQAYQEKWHSQNPSPKSHQSPQNPSPSPPPTTGSPSPPPQLGVPLLLQTVAISSPSKPQSSPWTHHETANLIQAYQEKWYSLKKGPLKAGQWEEVAITVAARCGYDEPTKTAKQCRHKIEKLRKRYRAERGKSRSKSAAWNFFKLMDNLERGPLPISSSRPPASVMHQKPSNSNGRKRKNDESDDEFLLKKRNLRSTISDQQTVNGSLSRNLRFSDGGSQRVMRRLRTPVFHRNKGFYQEEEEEEDGEDEDEGKGVGAQLAAEIKGFAEKFVKMENKKMEMIRDVERYRLEMENKRMEMILESQQMLVETVNKAFKTQKLSAK